MTARTVIQHRARIGSSPRTRCGARPFRRRNQAARNWLRFGTEWPPEDRDAEPDAESDHLFLDFHAANRRYGL